MKPEDYKVEFDENNRLKGSLLMSWLGLHVRQTFPYWIDTKQFEKKWWEELWLDTKKLWHIENDRPQVGLLRSFINRKRRLFRKYKYLDRTHWTDFVRRKTSVDFLKTSAKARESALANTNPAHKGRNGYRGLEDKADKIWPDLEEKLPVLKDVQHARTMPMIIGRAILNKKTKKYELAQDAKETVTQLVRADIEIIKNGTDFKGNNDPIVSVFGDEHGGRTRGFSEMTGSTKVSQKLLDDVKALANSGKTQEAQHVDSGPHVDSRANVDRHIIANPPIIVDQPIEIREYVANPPEGSSPQKIQWLSDGPRQDKICLIIAALEILDGEYSDLEIFLERCIFLYLESCSLEEFEDVFSQTMTTEVLKKWKEHSNDRLGLWERIRNIMDEDFRDSEMYIYDPGERN